NLSNLVDLNLSGNLINGSVPETFANLRNLAFVDLGRTQLSGMLPESLSQMTNLTHFYVYSTNLSGSLPKALSSLPRIATVGLWNNSITGSIPEEYANNSTLSKLYVQSNLITGNVPLSFLNSTVVQLDVSDNCLSTPIPLVLANHNGFTTSPQKVVCRKFAPENPLPPTTTPEVIDDVITNSSPTLQSPTRSYPSIMVSTVTIVQVNSATGTFGVQTPNTTPAVVNSSSNESHVMIIALSSGFGFTFLLLMVAGGVFIHKRTKDGVNEDGILNMDVTLTPLSDQEFMAANSEQETPSS
ncbi:hypothetical protein HDU76_010433, partial [Blyttiomyces sp. JEL0837]